MNQQLPGQLYSVLHAIEALKEFYKASQHCQGSARRKLAFKTMGLIQHDRILTNRVHNL